VSECCRVCRAPLHYTDGVNNVVNTKDVVVRVILKPIGLGAEKAVEKSPPLIRGLAFLEELWHEVCAFHDVPCDNAPGTL